jgi:hypothetical protein
MKLYPEGGVDASRESSKDGGRARGNPRSVPRSVPARFSMKEAFHKR